MVQNLEGEVWKEIEGYEGCYAVSNMGRVKSLERVVPFGPKRNMRTIKETLKKIGTFDNAKKGYRTVTLSKDSKLKICFVHRLVAEAFVSRHEGENVVNHIDCDINNNRADNLEWTTHKENSAHAKRNGLYTNIRPVINIDTGERFESIKVASKSIGVSCLSLSRALKNVNYTCRGYHWEYA